MCCSLIVSFAFSEITASFLFHFLIKTFTLCLPSGSLPASAPSCTPSLRINSWKHQVHLAQGPSVAPAVPSILPARLFSSQRYSITWFDLPQSIKALLLPSKTSQHLPLSQKVPCALPRQCIGSLFSETLCPSALECVQKSVTSKHFPGPKTFPPVTIQLVSFFSKEKDFLKKQKV